MGALLGCQVGKKKSKKHWLNMLVFIWVPRSSNTHQTKKVLPLAHLPPHYLAAPSKIRTVISTPLSTIGGVDLNPEGKPSIAFQILLIIQRAAINFPLFISENLIYHSIMLYKNKATQIQIKQVAQIWMNWYQIRDKYYFSVYFHDANKIVIKI